MIISVLRKTFAKGKPKTVFYRCYKNYDQATSNETLKTGPHYLSHRLIFFLFLTICSPYKQKKIRYKNNPFMTKEGHEKVEIA